MRIFKRPKKLIRDKKSKRKVCFDLNLSNRTDITAYDDDFENDLWYGENETKAFKIESRNYFKTRISSSSSSSPFHEICVNDNCESIKDDGDDERGLEIYNPLHRKRILKQRQDSMYAVFSMQQVQNIKGMTDLDNIAKVYSFSCVKAVEEALQIASKDEQFVKKYIHEKQ